MIIKSLHDSFFESKNESCSDLTPSSPASDLTPSPIAEVKKIRFNCRCPSGDLIFFKGEPKNGKNG